MALNLVQLETFRRLSELRNFTRTAESLDLTQPAVTQHVRALQDHFHVRLFDLVGRRTVLTDAGRYLALRSEPLLGNVAALEREMREFADARAGELRIGATITIGTYTLPDDIARFRAIAPAVRLHVEVANTQAMARAVKSGSVSVALVEGPLSDDELRIDDYACDDLVLIVARSHRFTSRRKPIASADLAAEPFVFREDGSGTRLQVERALLARDITPNVVLTLPTGEGIVRAVELGLGIAIVSKLVADVPVRDGRVALVAISDLELTRTFRTVRLRHQTPSPAVLAFIDVVRERGSSAGAAGEA